MEEKSGHLGGIVTRADWKDYYESGGN